jgi:hypothetical protein
MAGFRVGAAMMADGRAKRVHLPFGKEIREGTATINLGTAESLVPPGKRVILWLAPLGCASAASLPNGF